MTNSRDPRSAETTLELAATLADGDARADLLALELVAEGERYRVQGVVGAGGMGEVSAYRDARIGREVALKRIHPSRVHDGIARARFLCEARVQGRLEHPSVVPVYDLGLDAGGAPYFTMRRVRGHALDRILRDGDPDGGQRYTRRKLLEAFSRVCLAVDYAHRRGVVHRDLKPANLMLGDFGEVYVLDWGIARIAGLPADDGGTNIDDAGANTIDAPPIGSSGEHRLTQAGTVIGTLGYAAPEQLLGEEVDARADVYALGAILFEMLALEPLIPAADRIAAMATTLEGADARLSVRAPHRDVPPELEAIAVRATARQPVDRFASARALHDAVESFLDGDRDLELRRRAAERHVASAHLEPAVDEHSRRKALAELGRAIALDPEHAGAREALLRLLIEPPREAPADVVAELYAVRRRHLRFGAFGGAAAAAGWIAAVPLMVIAGVRSWPPIVAMVGAALVAALAALAALRATDERAYTRAYIANCFAIAVAIALTCVAFGPLIVVPALAAGNVTALALVAPRRRGLGWLTVGLNCAAVLIPLALQGLGIAPTFYSFDSGMLVVHPLAMELAPWPGYVLLIIGSTAPVLIPGAFAARLRADLDEAQLANALHAWQMKQLLG